MCLASSRSSRGHQSQLEGQGHIFLPFPSCFLCYPVRKNGFSLFPGLQRTLAWRQGPGSHSAEAERKACAGKSHPLLYPPVPEVPLFPSHTPCLLFHQRREGTRRCGSISGRDFLVFPLLCKEINPLSEEGDVLLFNHSLTRSFSPNSYWQMMLRSVLGTQPREGHRAPSCPPQKNDLAQPAQRGTDPHRTAVTTVGVAGEGRGHRERLGSLCGIGGALPLEEALSQGARDAPRFARLMNGSV